MSQNSIKASKISDILAERLESMILEGSLSPGQKLPPERELAAQFEVSRPSLREALQKLEAKSLVVRRQGGGTFISDDIGISFVDPLSQLFKSHPEFNYDLLEFRHALEEVAAHYAALRATDGDLQIIEQRYQDWLEGHEQRIGASEEAELDWRFHLSIAEASHNAVLLHSMRALFDLFKQTIATNLEFLYIKEDRRAAIRNQHEKMKNAVLARDAQAAQQAVNDHLAFVEETLQQSSRFATHAERSLRRIGLMRRG
ncbi:transcriptional regulator PdhR [Bacterioplanes sanyensis]|uniref:GntR family transcriptional regulator n=1 Tax=Bacterioplanes sanyensis TaxID=1249553 RepID=UPI001675C354|nr:GntR family transcriptional regulator [Bacterioplanes sanyensis]GGY42840.1 transcriptional regulator PdhR [Bacterioplanes sanyensis]